MPSGRRHQSHRATVADVARAAIADGTSRLERHAPGARLGVEEDVHRGRVATRRLRSDLRTFSELLDDTWVDEVRTELQWIAEQLGAVRDADVLHRRIRRQAAGLVPADRRAVTPVLRQLADERGHAQRGLAAALASDRYLALAARLQVGSSEPPWSGADAPRWIGDERASEVVPTFVRRTWKRLEKAVEALGDDPDDPALHEVRKRAKRCRYASEAAADVVGSQARKLAAQLAGLQEVLGDIQDAAVAEAWLRARLPAPGPADSSERAFALGLLVAAQAADRDRSRARWRSIWAKASRQRLRRWL